MTSIGTLQSTLRTSMLLLALLVIASAADYGYGPAPKLENSKPNSDYKPLPTKPYYGPAPKLENPKPNTDYELHIAKPDYGYVPASKPENPKPNTDYKPLPTKPDYGYAPAPKVENPKPKTEQNQIMKCPKQKGKDELQLLPTIIGVQGVVLCKSGSNYFPIQGNFSVDPIKSVKKTKLSPWCRNASKE